MTAVILLTVLRDGVERDELKTYPMLTANPWWSLRLEGWRSAGSAKTRAGSTSVKSAGRARQGRRAVSGSMLSERRLGLHWNAVPWYVGDGKRNASVTQAQVEQGRAYLLQLVDLAQDIRVIVALGKRAQASVAGAATALVGRGVQVLQAPHPGPIPAGVTKGRSLQEVNACVTRALEIAGAEGSHRTCRR